MPALLREYDYIMLNINLFLIILLEEGMKNQVESCCQLSGINSSIIERTGLLNV